MPPNVLPARDSWAPFASSAGRFARCANSSFVCSGEQHLGCVAYPWRVEDARIRSGLSSSQSYENKMGAISGFEGMSGGCVQGVGPKPDQNQGSDQRNPHKHWGLALSDKGLRTFGCIAIESLVRVSSTCSKLPHRPVATPVGDRPEGPLSKRGLDFPSRYLIRRTCRMIHLKVPQGT